jgi:hypothetical protein
MRLWLGAKHWPNSIPQWLRKILLNASEETKIIDEQLRRSSSRQ